MFRPTLLLCAIAALCASPSDASSIGFVITGNGITEGFHTKIEVLQRQAYGFRNFQNYRLRVRVMCC